MRKKMILLVLTLFIGLSACGNDDKELPDEPGKEQGGNGGSLVKPCVYPKIIDSL